MDNKPRVIEETSDFTVVFKPPKMHSVSLAKKKDETLTDWFADNGYADNALPDSGLMHRLDFETQGLVLFAKNQKSYVFFKDLQDRGEFIKEYSAVCENSARSVLAEGFPPPPDINRSSVPFVIESYFRPFGHGRKLVRPVIEEKKYHEIAKDKGGFYRTEITRKNGDIFTVRIRRGFRHQIRCHLCWVGFPIKNDPLYSDSSDPSEQLALRAHGLFFADPSTGERRECCIEALSNVI